jgi:hypothetical protein
MRKLIACSGSPVRFYLHGCMGIITGFNGSTRLRPLYFKLSRAFPEMRGWIRHLRPSGASVQHEGLGAVYDKRKWMENYYRNPSVKP